MIGHGLEDEERKDTWLEDAENCSQKVINHSKLTIIMWLICYIIFFISGSD